MCSRTKPVAVPKRTETNVADVSGNVAYVEVDDAFRRRIEVSVVDARRKISKRDATPTIEITGETDISIVVNDLTDQSGNEFMVIYRGNDTKHHTPFIKIPKDRFLYVYFGNLTGCRVFIKSKLLRVMFDRCDGCQVSVRTPIIGVVDFYKCKSGIVSFRIPEHNTNDTPIPLVTVEDCSDLHISQSVDSVLFAVKMSVDIYGTIIDSITGQRLERYDLGKIVWDTNEQNFVTLSRTGGFASVSSDFSLHQISHTLFMDSHGDHDIISSTPPFK